MAAPDVAFLLLLLLAHVLLLLGAVRASGGAARHDGEAAREQEPRPECAADVSGESVMIGRCRAACLRRFAAPPAGEDLEATQARCTSEACMMCWDHCGKLKRGPEYLAKGCKDANLCWEGCRAACDFHFPHGVSGAGPGGAGRGTEWSLRPTNEATTAAPPSALPPPHFDGLVLRWTQPDRSDEVTSTMAASRATASTPVRKGGAKPRHDLDQELEEDDEEDSDVQLEPAQSPAPSTGSSAPENVVYIVSASMAPTMTWKELKQTSDLQLELSASLRPLVRAVSVLAVNEDGPVALASACVDPHPLAAARAGGNSHRQVDVNVEEDYYDEDLSDEDDDDSDDDAGAAAIPDSSLQRLAQRSFAQLRGTVQHGVLLRALLRERAAAKPFVEVAAQDADEDADDEDDGQEDVLLDRRRLELVQQLLGGRGRGHGRKGTSSSTGWGLRLVGVWAAGGGARLPRAKVAWTAPRGVDETLVNWAVPALRISGSRVVSGGSQAEVPLVEQHATRVTVGDAHSSNVSPALVLQLSVQTDSSAASPAHQQAQQVQPLAPSPAYAVRSTPSYEQAALWEATLVAVGLVVGAAALCVALLLVGYGVHSRVARCCSRGRGHGIHAKSASVEPLNAPDQNSV